jgi:predicted metal-binding membrane protein
VRLGLHCSRACAGFTAILLVIGLMDLRAMAAVTVAITAERLVPSGRRVVWGVGAVAIAAGTYLTVRAAGLL